MKKSNLVLFASLFVVSCSSSSSSSSLGGGVLIPDSEDISFSEPSTSSSESSSSEVNKLSDMFIGTFTGIDGVQGADTTLEVDENGNAEFNCADYELSLSFLFVEETTRGDTYISEVAIFKDENENVLEMENGASFMFITVNDGAYLTDYSLSYDGAQFVRK